MDPTSANECERAQCDKQPEKDSLKERSNPDLAESLHGESRSNQEERDRQADAPKMLELSRAEQK
jgi:hypothetical protein